MSPYASFSKAGKELLIDDISVLRRQTRRQMPAAFAPAEHRGKLPRSVVAHTRFAPAEHRGTHPLQTSQAPQTWSHDV